jgi:hypothetical protein
MTNPSQHEVYEFLRESNAIECEYSGIALEDAMRSWDFVCRNLGCLTTLDVYMAHKYLMMRINPVIAGELRDCDVWVGNDRRIFISRTLLDDELLNIVSAVNSSCPENVDPGAYARITHICFEKLHPFFDGNGRIGRILYNVHRLSMGLPLHIIHVGEEQQEYYKWFD